jgi:RNA polymerase sigma-70 factor (ECF subfamily)
VLEFYKESEERIINGCISNDRRSQEILYRHFFPKMLSMCRRFTSDEDRLVSIINDGMLRVFLNIKQYKGSGSFEGWVRRIVFRSLSNHFRKDKNYLKVIFLEEKDKANKETALSGLYYEDLMRVVDELPEMMRKVFERYVILGMTHKEIGSELNISEGTSKWHLSKAREKLRERITNKNKLLNHA